MEFSIKVNTENNTFCKLTIHEDGIFTVFHTDKDGLLIHNTQEMATEIDCLIDALNVLKQRGLVNE